MKYLQTYKLWERLQDKRVPDETLISLHDILLPMKDDGFKIDIFSTAIGIGPSPSIVVGIKQGKTTLENCRWTIDHLLEYMKDDWNITDFWMLFRDTSGHFLKVQLWGEGKPVNSSISKDPLEWLERFFSETSRVDSIIDEIFICYKEK